MDNRFEDRRNFFRHPTEVPVECRVKSKSDFRAHAMRDISHGGVSFVSDRPYELGDMVELRYPSLRYDQALEGRIVWAMPLPDHGAEQYVHGVSFLDESGRMHGRIVEQICHIEAYRREQREKHNRELTSLEAATEWITANASEFPA